MNHDRSNSRSQKTTRIMNPIAEASQPAEPQPVNAFSNIVDPRKLYPLHFDALMHDLFSCGEQPESWRVLDASETRLDEEGQEIEFTLVKHQTDVVWRRRILAAHGRVVRVTTA